MEIFYYLCSRIQGIIINVVNGINSESIDNVLGILFPKQKRGLECLFPADNYMTLRRAIRGLPFFTLAHFHSRQQFLKIPLQIKRFVVHLQRLLGVAAVLEQY